MSQIERGRGDGKHDSKYMMTYNITDDDLRGFCKWFGEWHGFEAVAASVMTTCMTGYFKTYTREAEKILARCVRLDLLAETDGKVTFIRDAVQSKSNAMINQRDDDN